MTDRKQGQGSRRGQRDARRTDHIAGNLRDDILRGRYKPGDRLPAERDLASKLSANRTSVREALKTLEQLGLVVSRHGGGTTVCRLEDASVEIVRHLLIVDGRIDTGLALQVLDVHEMLVAGAARLALERATDDDLLHARELLVRLAVPSCGAEERVQVIDELFDLITEASGNLVLRLVRNAIGPMLNGELGRAVWSALRPEADILADQIDDIDRAIAARDPLATEEAVRSLLRDRRERLIALLQDPEFRIAPGVPHENDAAASAA